MSILVTGAAGYIESHAVKALLARGATVVGVDNFSEGKRAAIDAWFAGPAFGGPEPSAEPAVLNGD